MRHQQRDEYHVLDWPDKPEMLMTHLFRTFPEIVVDRYLVNTSFDSGYLKLSDTEITDGWFMHGRFAHSPKILKPDQIPRDQFDEWLVFEDGVKISRFETLVNYCNFTPIDFAWEDKLDEFWSQIEEYRPLHVIGENDRLYFVSRDAELAERIREAEHVEGGKASPATS